MFVAVRGLGVGRTANPALSVPGPTYHYMGRIRCIRMGTGEGTLSPDGAFRILGEETRMATPRAVWESPDEPVSFSEIRARIGNPDSGQFNYHLNKLEGHFLSSDSSSRSCR